MGTNIASHLERKHSLGMPAGRTHVDHPALADLWPVAGAARRIVSKRLASWVADSTFLEVVVR